MMNKEAQLMFEELGYKLIYKNKYEVKYAKEDKFMSEIMKQKYYESTIIINFQRKDFHKNGCYIEFNELKAINEQIFESGLSNE